MPVWHIPAVARLVYTLTSAKTLDRLPRNVAGLIRDKLRRLAADPFGPQPQAARLKGSPTFRLRVGDWRVMYEIEDDVVRVLDVKPRGGAYD